MPYDYGMIFKNAHSGRDYKLVMQSIDRSLLPSVKRQQIDILNISGKYDLQKDPVYANRIITVKFGYVFDTLEDMQAKKRQVAQWLSGRSNLIFDDEPTKTWDAKVFEAIAIDQTTRIFRIQVAFECSPYAYGAEVTVPIVNGKNPIDYQGNIKTPTLIIIRNNGSLNVETINISAVVRVTGKGTTT